MFGGPHLFPIVPCVVACSSALGPHTTPPQNETLTAIDQPPTVLLGDQAVAFGDSVTLAPRVSDPEGAPLSIEWSLVLAPPFSAVSPPPSDEPTFTFQPDRLGTYAVYLTVSDGYTPISVLALVDVLLGTDRPVAMAGDDRAVAVGRAAHLDASESTSPDGRPLWYEWFLAEAPDDSGLAVRSFDRQTTFVPDVTGRFRFELRVHDGQLVSAPDDLVFEVKPDDVFPGDVATGTLLGRQVYVMGTTSDPCTNAVAHWSDLDTLVGGLDRCSLGATTPAELDPVGELFYLQTDGLLRRFRCDDCPEWQPGDPIDVPHGNDEPVETPHCDGTKRPRPTSFLMGANGSLLLYCGEWVDDRGRTVWLMRGAPLAFDGTVALTTAGELANFSDGRVKEVGQAFTTLTTARTTFGGFWVHSFGELLFIDAVTGAVRRDGAYSSAPFYGYVRDAAIDADGTLIELVADPYMGEQSLHRRRLDGVSDVLWTSEEDTAMQDVVQLVTGP